MCLSPDCEALLTSEEPEQNVMCNTQRHTDWDFTEGHSNILTEYNLYCDRMWLISMGTTLYFVGFFVAVAPLSAITDKLGRKLSSELFIVLYILLLLLLGLSGHLYQIFICRILLGACHGGFSVSASVAFYEFTTADTATLNMMISSAAFSLGGGLAGLTAMWASHWVLTVVPPLVGFLILGVLFHFIVPETPHWLFARGYEARAIASLNKVAKFNGAPALHNIELVSATGEVTTSKKSQGFSILWRVPFLRESMACLAFGWFTVAICYYGLEFNAASLGNEYVIMILMGCFDTPFKLSMYVFAGRLGRRSACQVYLGGALLCLILSGVPLLDHITVYGNFTVKTVLVSCGRALGGSVFALLYLYTTEVLPTLVRSLGLSCCSTIARIGSLLAPFVILVNQVSPYIIYVFIVASLLVSIKLLRRIPETLGKPLPNSLEDCEKLFGIKKGKQKCEDDIELNLIT